MRGKLLMENDLLFYTFQPVNPVSLSKLSVSILFRV